MNRKYTSVLLILIGLLILVYPVYNKFNNEYQQKKIMLEWEETFKIIGEEQDLDKDEDKDEIKEEEVKVIEKKKIIYKSEGILKIKKINLSLPILTDATTNNLDISLASLKNTGSPGEEGNYGIAGHRGRVYGHLLNRLDEVEEGDTITVETAGGTYDYVVIEKLLVEPEDVWVLKKNGNKREITLVTCHPIKNPTHRLIVKGEMVFSS